MQSLSSKTIIYDCHCPLCTLYTGVFIKVGVLGSNGRVSFQQADESLMEKLDLTRARHEIPLIDTQTGEVLYGLDGLTLIISHIFPFLRPLLMQPWFRKLLTPFYRFISYNRRIIAGSPATAGRFNPAPDFHLGWRLALIALGLTYTAWGIYLFAMITGIQQLVLLYAMVGGYFLLLLGVNIGYHQDRTQQWDYLGHLAVLGMIESTLFILTAGIAHLTQLTGLLFAAQGACRLYALRLHEHRVRHNGFSNYLNYAFALGAVVLIVYLAIILK